MMEVRDAILETTADRRWYRWLDKHLQYRADGIKCNHIVSSIIFWRNVEKIYSILEPLFSLLRMVDQEGIVIGKVYWKMHEIINVVKNSSRCGGKEKSQIVQAMENRWQQLHTPIHGAAFALHPEFQLHEQSQNVEIVKNFRTVCMQLLPGDQGKRAYQQRVLYTNREGAFGDVWNLDAIKVTPACMWWKEYGGETLELQYVAVHVLSVAASAGTCERNWSSYDFVMSKRRNRLKPSRASDLVYCHGNLKILKDMSKKRKYIDETCNTIEDDVNMIQSEDEDEIELCSNASDVQSTDDINAD